VEQAMLPIAEEIADQEYFDGLKTERLAGQRTVSLPDHGVVKAEDEDQRQGGDADGSRDESARHDRRPQPIDTIRPKSPAHYPLAANRRPDARENGIEQRQHPEGDEQACELLKEVPVMRQGVVFRLNALPTDAARASVAVGAGKARRLGFAGRHQQRGIMRVLLAAIAAILLAATPACAGGKLLDYGIYQTGGETNCDFSKPIGNCDLNFIAHVATTTEIPGAIGVTFGIHYALDSGQTLVRHTVVFPPAGLKNPRFPQTVHVINNDTSCNGADCSSLYTLDFPWEVVTGVWTFQVWAGGKVVIEKKLRVVLPNKKPKKVDGVQTASLNP
jgi:hypothetical protein